MIEKLQELDSKSLTDILKEAEYYSSQRQQTSEELNFEYLFIN